MNDTHGQHWPRCNDQCQGDSHYLAGVSADVMARVRGLTSVGAATLHVNGEPYIRQRDLIDALRDPTARQALRNYEETP